MSSFQETIPPQERYDDGLVTDTAALSRMWTVLDQSVAEFNHGHRTITLYPCQNTDASVDERSKDSSKEDIS